MFAVTSHKRKEIKKLKQPCIFFLQDAAEVAKKFMARDPDEVNFTLMALSKAE